MDAPTNTFNPNTLYDRLAGIESSLDAMHNQQEGFFKKLMTPVNAVNITAQRVFIDNAKETILKAYKHLSPNQISLLNKEISRVEAKLKVISGDTKEQYPSQESLKESFTQASKGHEEFAALIKEYLAHIYREDFMVNGKMKKLDEDSIKKTSLRRHLLREMIGSSENLNEKEVRQLSRLYTPELSLEDLTKEKIMQTESQMLEEFLTLGGKGASIFYQELQKTTHVVAENIPFLRIRLLEKRAAEKEEVANQKNKIVNDLKTTASNCIFPLMYSEQIGEKTKEYQLASSEASTAKQLAEDAKKTVAHAQSKSQAETTSLGDFDLI